MQLGTCNIGPGVSRKDLEKVRPGVSGLLLDKFSPGELGKRFGEVIHKFSGKRLYEISTQVSVIRLDEVIPGCLEKGLMRSLLNSFTQHSRFLCNIGLYSIGPFFYHQSHPHLGIVFAWFHPFICPFVTGLFRLAFIIPKK